MPASIVYKLRFVTFIWVQRHKDTQIISDVHITIDRPKPGILRKRIEMLMTSISSLNDSDIWNDRPPGARCLHPQIGIFESLRQDSESVICSKISNALTYCIHLCVIIPLNDESDQYLVFSLHDNWSHPITLGKTRERCIVHLCINSHMTWVAILNVSIFIDTPEPQIVVLIRFSPRKRTAIEPKSTIRSNISSYIQDHLYDRWNGSLHWYVLRLN